MPSHSGIELSRRFYELAVRPLLERYAPRIPHAAGLIGPGSEVLGFDDAMSQDHDWGPRVQLFFREGEVQADVIERVIADLPEAFEGIPYAIPDKPTRTAGVSGAPIKGIEVHTPQTFLKGYLGLDWSSPLSAEDWLTLPQQKLKTITEGPLFHDEVGFANIRRSLHWYPHDVWLYLLACGWQRIGQEEHLMGRAGAVGDTLGSALIGARLVRDTMRLCFLMEQTYAPYAKWLGTAFRRLKGAEFLERPLASALRAVDWQTRENHLIEALEHLAAMQNALKRIPPMPETAVSFHDRPFRVVAFLGYADRLFEAITDPELQALAKTRFGNIDQISDNTDFLGDVGIRERVGELYRIDDK